MGAAVFDLLGADVAGGADELIHAGGDGVAGAFAFEDFGNAEVDDLGDGLAGLVHDHDVAGLDVAVDDALLVGVVHGAADGDEEGEALAEVEVVLLAVLGDGAAFDHLHDEVGGADVRLAGIEDAGDVGMLHDGEGALLDGEAAEDVCGGDTGFDDLDGDDAVDGLDLLCAIDDAEAAFAELVEKAVAVADPAVVAGEGLHVGARLGGGAHGCQGRRRGGGQAALAGEGGGTGKGGCARQRTWSAGGDGDGLVGRSQGDVCGV